MAGIAGLFLPFTEGTSPVEAVSDSWLWRLALPFFLAIPASAASIRWIISRSFSRTERVIAYVASAATAGVTLSACFLSVDRPMTIPNWLATLSPAVIIALGVYLLIRNSRMGASREFNPVMAIQTAYVANAALCLFGFFPEWQRGAYCVLVAALAFVLQIILASASPFVAASL
jgi:hypothetical protein